MLVDRGNYFLSMGLVYLSVLTIELLFPLFMWRDYLKAKPWGEKFMFCTLTQTTFLVNVVIFLGILKICNRWTILLCLALEYAAVRWTYSDKQQIRKIRKFCSDMKMLIAGDISIQSVGRTLRGNARRRRLERKQKQFGVFLKTHAIELVLGCGILLYNAFFLCHNVNYYHSYQFSDIPVHTSWVYALENGTLFVDGVYPFAMHALIYVVRVLTNLSLREIMLYYGSVHSLYMIVTLYLFSRKILRSRFSSLFVMLALSLLLNQGRYAASLPQECGVFAMFTMGYYLIEYLDNPKAKHIVKGDGKLRSFFRINQYWSRRYLNYPFFMLTLSVAQVIAFHFYTAIAAIVLALAIVGMRLFVFLKKQYFVPIVTAACLGACIAIVPFILALLSGLPFHGSMGWALSVIQGTEWEGTGYGYMVNDGSGNTTELQDMSIEEEAEETTLINSDIPLTQKLLSIGEYMIGYNSRYLFGSETLNWAVASLAASLLFGAVFLLIPSLRRMGCNYISMAGFVLVLVLMGISQGIGLPVIFEPPRANVFAEPILLIVLGIPLDILFCLFGASRHRTVRAVLNGVSIAACIAACWWICSSGAVHAYFDVNLAYYNEPDYLIRQIQKEFEPFSYTIVSPTDEFYIAIEEGFHTELSELVSMVDGTTKEVVFPTKYVFFFIEKYTLQDYFNGSDFVSREYAQSSFIYQASTQDYFYQRNIMESKAYYWVQDYMALYPGRMTIYFENDIYIACLLEQNVNSPLSLRLPA